MFRILLAASLFAFAVTTRAQALLEPPPAAPTPLAQELAKVKSVPALLARGKAMVEQEDWAGYAEVMQRVIALRPHAGNIRLELAAAYAMRDLKSEAYDVLLKLQQAGYGYAIEDDARFSKIQGTQVWDYLVEQFGNHRKPFGTGRVAHTLPKDDLMIEALAYDPKRKELLVGTVRTGEVRRLREGKLVPFIRPDAKNGLHGVFDLAVDAKRDLLWVASSAVAPVKHAGAKDYGTAAIAKFRLSDGEFLGRMRVPADGRNHLLTSVATNARGDVYAADSLNQAIYRVKGDALELVVYSPNLSSIRGLALNDAFLYFADYELGFYAIDLAKGQAFPLTVDPTRYSAFGIEGVTLYDGTLIAVQNGIVPRRAVRFHLSEDGRRITRAQPLDAGHPALAMPTRGTLAGDRFVFIANTQKDAYDRYGVPKLGTPLQAVQLFESDPRYAWDAARTGVAPALRR